ncbi:MAG: MaoC family dehydratase N-terminal domain-containing protein, partial [Actinobacteria bacterium]|nr:MaoC family dehydratase N-terminal domain-containing protein [Actinomycetota bacterium]
VRAEEIANFAAVIGESDLSVAPPTFSIRITLEQSQGILSDPNVGLDWSRVVHGDQKFKIFRPVVAGDIFRCSSTIENYREVAGNEIVTVRSDLHSGEELVLSSWSTLVVRG